MPGDVISTLEVIYGLERDHQQWLLSICESVRPWFDLGRGVLAWAFEASPRISHVGQTMVVGGEASMAALPDRYLEYFGQADVGMAYASGPCTTGQASFPEGRFSELCPAGIDDFLATLAISPDGVGVILGAPSARRYDIPRRVRYRSERVAAHLANAFRLRRRLEHAGGTEAGSDSADAVLTPDGKLLDANSEASRSRAGAASLREAVVRMERARGPQRRVSPEEALETWQALVSGQWSLMDHYEAGGRRYLIAMKNPVNIADPRALSARERQVVAYVALGYSGKQIAYALGISPSTVSRHLQQGLRKLGLRSTVEVPAYLAKLLRRAQGEELS